MGLELLLHNFYGAGDEAGTASAIRNGSKISILSTLIVSVIALVVTKPILILLNTPVSLLEDAAKYMLISLGGLVIVILYYIPFSILRSLGERQTTPIYFLACCSIIKSLFLI